MIFFLCALEHKTNMLCLTVVLGVIHYHKDVHNCTSPEQHLVLTRASNVYESMFGTLKEQGDVYCC